MFSKLLVYMGRGHDPYENLAIEKLLFDSLQKDAFIIYLWQNQNTVVLGKNQNVWQEINLPLAQSEGVRLVRRLSGGGAVYHDLGNLNFTFICNAEDYNLERNMQIIKDACLSLGIKAELSGRNDILADGRKFSGNAFYNSHGKCYHHGTILISSDMQRLSRFLTPKKAKLESKGIKSVRSRVINLCELSPELTPEKMADALIKSAEKLLCLTAEKMASIDKKEISPLCEKFGDWFFIHGTPIALDASFEGHFAWGDVEIILQIKNGIIEDARLYTDSLDHELASDFAALVKGSKFSFDELKSRLGSLQKSQDILSLFKNII